MKGEIEKRRWEQLMRDDDMKLTQDEIDSGWHFCPEWDGLLIGPSMSEWEHCLCDIEFRNPA